MNINTYTFKKAESVWESGTEKLMNRTLSFRILINPAEHKNITLSFAASCVAIVTVNGKFVAYGPARAAHGFYRVDEISLDGYLSEGENIVAVRVTGYNMNSFCYLDQPSFFCAELTDESGVFAYTSPYEAGGFTVSAVKERICKVQRMSYQRTFVESYDLAEGAFASEQDISFPVESSVELSATEAKTFICRDIPYGDYEILLPTKTNRRGKVSYEGLPCYDDRCLYPSDIFKAYPLEELEYNSNNDIDSFRYSNIEAVSLPTDSMTIDADSFLDISLERDFCGIFEFDLESEGGNLYLLYEEMEDECGGVNPRRKYDFVGCTAFRTEAGSYHISCTEPEVLSCLRFIAKGGKMTVKNFHLIKIAFPPSKITSRFISDDKQMEKIYTAAVETFVANTTDIYMDCPSRERAGWLCDSFFTSRVEKTLTGKSVVERAFLQNFLLPEKFEGLPEGMLPMCYPSDHPCGQFIPNWAMWYVLELGEYLERSGDRSLIDDAKERVYALAAYFKKFENEYGLLEKLESWVFVEWSKANELVQDVNFPSNMLYAKFKRVIAELYDDKQLMCEADALTKTVHDMSFTGKFFCDNALRGEDGKLTLSGECTEACQYYAFFFDIATPDTHKELWDTLVADFGYDRKVTKKHPEIYFANAFIGNYLRLDLLDRYGYEDMLIDNIRGYFTYMADATGTLWENDTSCASVNHGFASHVAYWMARHGYLA